MTLIACTINHGFPVMVADVLFTHKSRTESIQLPTNSINITPYLGDVQAYPIYLCQKIYIVAKNVCISFSGYSDAISDFLTEIKIRLAYYEPNLIKHADIEQFINDCKHPPAGRLIYCISIVDLSAETPWQTYFSPSAFWNVQDNDTFQTAFASGSGSANFLRQVNEFGYLNTTSYRGDPKWAIEANVSMTARLLAAEKVSLFNIKEYWGAGYEVAFFNGTSFEKCDEYAYLIFRGKFNDVGDIDILTPELVLYYKYYDNYLGITALELQAANWNEIGENYTYTSYLLNRNFYMVPPIDRLGIINPSYAPENYSFETRMIGVGYALFKEGGGIYTPSFFSQHSDNLNIKYEHGNGGLEIRINKLVHNAFLNAAKTAYPNIDR